MRTRVLVAAAALLAVTLSGCTEAGYLNPYGPPADDEPVVDDGNETGNETAPPSQNETPPAPAPQGTFTISAPANFTVNETFEVQLNYYYPGNEPRAPVYGNSTGNETGNSTDNRTVIDPGHPGTPAYHNDAWWVLNVTQGGVTLSFNGTSVPATISLSLNLSVNATLHATYQRSDVNLSASLAVPVIIDQADPTPETRTLTGTVTGGVHVAGSCFTSYPTFAPEVWGWHYEMPAGWATEWWSGDSDFVAGGSSGTVPPNTDNVGACRTNTLANNYSSWTIILTSP